MGIDFIVGSFLAFLQLLSFLSLHNISRLSFLPSRSVAFVRCSAFSTIRKNSFIKISMSSFAGSSEKFQSAVSDPSQNARDFSNYTDSLQFYNALRSCKDQYICNHVNKALDTLSDALRLYGPHRIFSSYNGGKDADVIMHLLRAVYAKYSSDHSVNETPEMVYFVNPDEFEEVTEHIERSQNLYNLRITTYDNGIVEGLKQHLNLRGQVGHCAFVLGTRKGDPNCGDQEVFAPSSSWMPIPFMRLNPIIHWEYGHVWHFLRTFNLSYCSLYDVGYTSLGKKSQTFPNPALLRKNPTPVNSSACSTPTSPEYWPAYMLSDWSLERCGREKSTSLKPANYKSESERIREEEERQGSKIEVGAEGDHLPVKIGENDEKQCTDHLRPILTSTQTAALLIIGDEILNGFTEESNLKVTAQSLAKIGIPLKKVSIVSDDVHDIAQEVQRLSQKYDIVFTSGGIGPTHDDVTLKAIAQALHQDLKMNSQMLQHLETVCAEQRHQQQQSPQVSSESSSKVMIDESMRRQALLPEQSQLRFPPPPDDYYFSPAVSSSLGTSSPMRHKTWPILQCDNVFILPGVPQFFASKMQLIAKHFLTKQELQERWKIILDIEERALLTDLDAVVGAFPWVKIGSYPYVEHPEFKTILTVEAAQVTDVEAAVQALITTLPPHAVLRVERVVSSTNASSENHSPN